MNSTIELESVELAEPLEVLGPRGRIGLVALATDLCSEQELRTMLPHGVEMYTNRVMNANPTTIENLRAMGPDIGRAAAGIVPDVDLDVMIYGCTSGTVVLGEETVFRAMREARGEVRCTTPITATLAAISSLGGRRISVVTPYVRSVNEAVGQMFGTRGLDVINIAGMNIASDADMTAVTPESIRQAALKGCRDEADLLFISCTALRTAGVVGQLEEELGRPVVTSNQALVWHAMELIGRPWSVDGFGSLFRCPLTRRQ